MNVPAPKFMIESTWSGRLFGGEWSSAAGGSLAVLEPATGKRSRKLATQRRRMCEKPLAKLARLSPDGRRPAMRSEPQSCGRPRVTWKTTKMN
jgi:hypothetical protein